MYKIKRILQTLFGGDAPSCRICGAYTQNMLCEGCEQEMKSCLHSGEREISGIKVYSPFFYDGMARYAIKRFKFDGCPWMSVLLAEYMKHTLADIQYDIMTYIPLHKRRQGARGYNQAQLLAEALDESAQPTLLRIRNTKPQYRLPVKQRKSNVRGAFEIMPTAQVRGKRILVVDDIVTTGSTLISAAGILRQAGAGEIFALSFASTN